MDRAEAVKILEIQLDVTSVNTPSCIELHEALDLAIEALQESQTTETQGERMTRIVHELSGCDAESATTTDCVSRQQAIEAVKNICNTPCNEYFVKVIESLPPVTPTERTGEWVVYPLIDDGRVELECSECGDTFVRAVDYKPDFCENCGAKMGGDTK